MMDWFKIGKEYIKAVYCYLVYLTYMQSTSFDMLGCLTHKLESRLLGQTSTTWYADDTTLMAEREEELNSVLIQVKEDSEKASLKLNIQKTKIMASDPITLWQIDGEKLETVTDLIFFGSEITMNGDFSHKIKRRLLLWKKSYDQPRQHVKKQRHYFAERGPSSQSSAFSSSLVPM